MGHYRGSTQPGNGGVCRWDLLDLGEIHLPRRLAHGSDCRRSRRSAAHGRLAGVSRSSRPWRPTELLLPSTASAQPTWGRMVDAASSASSVSARTWRPAELPPPSRASTRPDTGKHWRRRLASSASSASARPWRLAELLPPSPGGTASSATRGHTTGGVQPWRPAELPPSPASARPVSRTRGCLLLVGPSAARPTASSSSAGLDAWIHAQSRFMTLSGHRKLE
jgi:hypothetical protein